MAMLATVTGPSRLKPECPNVLRLRSVEQSMFRVKKFTNWIVLSLFLVVDTLR